jgi:hypothetical protein
MQINVKLNNKTIILSVEKTDTIESLKTQLYEKENIMILRQRLIFSGKELADLNSLENCNIQNESTIHCVLKLYGD